ncbi:MAG: hypothetical protein IT365_29390 [Candidatus Hydrogenedentes bacterium]|nr:hypothetical protein [Candidatus Hydrogenedentota bacterium]
MQPEPRTKPIRVQVLSTVREEIDPGALWLDDSVEAEDLMRLDPLDVAELEAQAEQPELADYNLQRLPSRGYSERLWAMMWRVFKRELQEAHGGGETGEAFQARIRGST